MDQQSRMIMRSRKWETNMYLSIHGIFPDSRRTTEIAAVTTCAHFMVVLVTRVPGLRFRSSMKSGSQSIRDSSRNSSSESRRNSNESKRNRKNGGKKSRGSMMSGIERRRSKIRRSGRSRRSGRLNRSRNRSRESESRSRNRSSKDSKKRKSSRIKGTSKVRLMKNIEREESSGARRAATPARMGA